VNVGKYLDIIRRAEPPDYYDGNDINDRRSSPAQFNGDFGRLCRFGRTLSELEHRCPDCIEPSDWQCTVDDAHRFLARWRDQADALGWTEQDLFALAPVSGRQAPNYCRLSRYDMTGLCWLLRGRPVVALTDATAAIENPSGAITIYRKHRTPSLGVCHALAVSR
jgi:hypothetical protein